MDTEQKKRIHFAEELQEAILKDHGKVITLEEATEYLREYVEYFSTLKKICSRIEKNKKL